MLTSGFLGACGDDAPDSVGASDAGAETQSKNDSEAFSGSESGVVPSSEPSATTGAWSESSTGLSTGVESDAGAGSSTEWIPADTLTVTGGSTTAPVSTTTEASTSEPPTNPPLDSLQVDLSDALGQDPEGWAVGGGTGVSLERQSLDGTMYLAASVPDLSEGLRTFSWRLNDVQKQARETFTGFGFWVCGTGNVLTRASTERDDGNLDDFVTETQPATLVWQFVQVAWSELGQLNKSLVYRVGFGATIASELRVIGFQFLQENVERETDTPSIDCPVQQKELDQ